MSYVEIPVGPSLVALVDTCDAEAIRAFSWQPDFKRNTVYAMRRDGRATLYMHTQLTGYAMTDHINGNGLDNRRKNLRAVTHVENARNMRRTGGSSRFKGVSRHKDPLRRPWRARIKLPAGEISLGLFGSQEEAAYAYDAAARELFGEHAALNFPRQGERSAHRTEPSA